MILWQVWSVKGIMIGRLQASDAYNAYHLAVERWPQYEIDRVEKA